MLAIILAHANRSYMILYFQICRGVLPEFTEPLSWCTRTNLWCRWAPSPFTLTCKNKPNPHISLFAFLQVPYRLHAVLVHEGQANAGHYWAYIYDPHQRCWMKYNDISVTKSSWEELVRDSFGGYRNASAYCLMYINDKKPFLTEGKNELFSGACISLLVVILEKWLVSECWLDCLWGFWALYHITLCHQPLSVSIPKCVCLCS